MNEDVKPKEKAFEFPMMPIFGLDLGRELGSIDSRLTRGESDMAKLDAKIDALDAKFDAKIDALDAKFEAKFDALDAKFEAKFDALDAKIDALETKLDAKIEARFNAQDAKIEARFNVQDAKFEAKFNAQDAKIDNLAYTLNSMGGRIKNLESRFNLVIGLNGAVLTAIIAAMVVQFFFK